MTARPRLRVIEPEPEAPRDEVAYCGVCSAWTESMVLRPVKIPDPADPSREIELMLCGVCEKTMKKRMRR